MYKHRNMQQCSKNQTLLIHFVHFLDKYNKIPQNSRHIHQDHSTLFSVRQLFLSLITISGTVKPHVDFQAVPCMLLDRFNSDLSSGFLNKYNLNLEHIRLNFSINSKTSYSSCTCRYIPPELSLSVKYTRFQTLWWPKKLPEFLFLNCVFYD